jgi:hypothetical protein
MGGVMAAQVLKDAETAAVANSQHAHAGVAIANIRTFENVQSTSTG